MARKLPRLQRVLDAPALFSVAYGELASSLSFALGIIALHALGFTPVVLLLVGALFLLVSLSYAEGTAAIPETGGAATFVRKAFNDFLGFLTGWALFLDYLIVIALSALFLPHYVAGALKIEWLDRKPGDVIPRSLFSAIGLVVAIYVAIAVVGLSAFPAHGGTTELGTTWLRSPLMGIVAALQAHVPDWLGGMLRVYVGLSGAFILLIAATTSMGGFGRLAYSLGEHGQLPRDFGRLNRRTLLSPQAIAAAGVISTALLVGTSFSHAHVAFPASLFSFGVLLAFTAAQLAVIALRVKLPDLPRPYRVPFPVTIRGAKVPLPSLVGAVLT